MRKPQYLGLIAATVLGTGTGVSAHADPPPWASAHGQRAQQPREYRYVYYPAQQIYYATEQQIWFWINNGGSWNFGVNLPARYRAQRTEGVPVILQGDRPYIQHQYVEKHYGQPWREKRKVSEKRHGRRHRDD